MTPRERQGFLTWICNIQTLIHLYYFLPFLFWDKHHVGRVKSNVRHRNSALLREATSVRRKCSYDHEWYSRVQNEAATYKPEFKSLVAMAMVVIITITIYWLYEKYKQNTNNFTNDKNINCNSELNRRNGKKHKELNIVRRLNIKDKKCRFWDYPINKIFYKGGKIKPLFK